MGAGGRTFDWRRLEGANERRTDVRRREAAFVGVGRGEEEEDEEGGIEYDWGERSCGWLEEREPHMWLCLAK
jgi:hypothetical protein